MLSVFEFLFSVILSYMLAGSIIEQLLTPHCLTVLSLLDTSNHFAKTNFKERLSGKTKRNVKLEVPVGQTSYSGVNCRLVQALAY